MSAVSPQVDSVCKGLWWRVLCHRLGRMVNNLTMPFALSRPVQQGVERRAEGFAHRGWDRRQFLRQLEERVAQAVPEACPRKQRAQTLGRAVEAIGEGPFDPIRWLLLRCRTLKFSIRLGESCCTGLRGIAKM